ncbi:o-succinylbenzoate synthase [soil metagenome]
MSLRASFLKKTLNFSFKARTSRGAMNHKDSWFIKVWDDREPGIFGIGEAGPLPGLSPETGEDVEEQFNKIIKLVSKIPDAKEIGSLAQIHQLLKAEHVSGSVLFALETAFLDLRNGGVRTIFQNEFVKGQAIPINGLVWMGGLDEMLQQVSIKISEGFSCVKLKIGSLNFEKEVDILQFIRRKYFRDVIEIRLDANGSFRPEQALYKIMDCARYDISSIEQPLKAGSAYLPELCSHSPIPIGLDEELIGVTAAPAKVELLERIKPAFIILKPSLHGGLFGCEEWIRLAEERGIGWWMTSALESNIGLNAIAQFTANYPIYLPQGLGTGAIYDNNIPSPLVVKKGTLSLNSQENWDLSEFN